MELHGRKTVWLIILSGMGILTGLMPAFTIAQNPSHLQGVITNTLTGNPIIGAKVTVSGQVTYSVSGGNYLLDVNSPGTYTVTCTKAGFDGYTSVPVTFQAGITITLNIPLLETANPVPSVTAVFDSAGPNVHLSWPLPSGLYEKLYDDGIQDDFTIWATQGNKNAVKFTPIGYPAKITGGSVNIGASSNYPGSSNPFVPFQVFIYDATGAGGMPGNVIAGPVDVIPVALGWVEFTVPNPPTIDAGNLYIAMSQGGNTPNAAGLAIDQTNPQFRSVSKFGSSPWLPGDGNYMIRAVISGPGGPGTLMYKPLSVQDYQVWRLRQGEEQNPYVWTSVGLATATNIIDNSWPSLPCGPYRWSVKAHYSQNRWSISTFSNVLGKCWTVPTGVHVDLSCTAEEVAGTSVHLKNLVYPDTLYVASLDTSGFIMFPKVWKGTYELKISRFGYQAFQQTYAITKDTTFAVILLQVTSKPQNLIVNNKSLKATWQPPSISEQIFQESWDTANFFNHEWTVQGGFNWVFSLTNGKPAPSVMFASAPQVTNYNETLTSKYITGDYSTVLQLNYLIMLDNYGATTVNQMAVEIWDGTNWNTLKTYSNLVGDFSWINESLDISAYSNLTFKFRFRAFGGDSFDINAWYIDNIRILATESKQNMLACVLGYNFYLQNILLGFTSDTTFSIPENDVQYGGNYTACVQAVYGSGSSSRICCPFTSNYLVPPTGLQGTGIQNSALLTWNKPVLDTTSLPPPGLVGYYIYRGGLIHDSVMQPDTLHYYDYGLDPGTYFYDITAKYDLASYGFPGQYDQSMKDGPDSVVINYGYLLPFLETWDQATFGYQNWIFDPDQGNWNISASEGNPPPCAVFSGDPPRLNYASALESSVLNAIGVNCATVWLDYDCRILNNTPAGTEKLSVGVYYNNIWHGIAEYKNDQDQNWFPVHKNISAVSGKPFRIRFLAEGLNSAELQSWTIDNIHVYGISFPARDLSAGAEGVGIRLTWNPPKCTVGNPLNEGFEESVFPPPLWTQIITNATDTWQHTTSASPLGSHSGNYAAGIPNAYAHQDEWLIAHNIYVTGPLTFWSYGFQGSVHLDHYYVKVSADSGATWQVMFDLSALPPYPGTGGFNQWNEAYTIDMSYYEGMVLDIAWQAVDGDGLGIWYPWSIDDCMIGSRKLSPIESGSFAGYDVYRKNPDSVNFTKLNTGLVPETTFFDPSPPVGQIMYFVNAVFNGCAPTPSDTILIVFTTNSEVNDLGIIVFPNPAKDILHIRSDQGFAPNIPAISERRITDVVLTNYLGQVVFKKENPGTLNFDLPVNTFRQGLYILRINHPGGTFQKKISILH
ncbi:MAG: choice-of-anchor J domain-containing protein [Bacteroidetes bacterium]|nr:choice-of-anchor J domain-containing protein [Bacteroidota bacterium]